jgi:hypothetical protein
MNLCKHKNLFGEPNTGIHKTRFLNVAIVDVIATILVSFIIYFIMIKIKPQLGTFKYFLYILLSLFILGIILHHIFCVRTTIDKLIFN